ncbi:MAG TPA: hypothetical protein VFS64_04840 [Solirubrobacterales bacterium]|nr:hypothetical protein [Solirubrobacterales bacterium]
MAVMAREAWTDERLDDFRAEVNRRFDSVEADIRELRSEIKASFAEVDKRIDSMQRTMIVCFSGMTASIVASIIGAILVTQL